jgi:hypothetical protein
MAKIGRFFDWRKFFAIFFEMKLAARKKKRASDASRTRGSKSSFI